MSDGRYASLRVSSFTLTVHDLDRVGRYYREVVGLHELGSDRGSARFGTGEAVLLELRRDVRARPQAPRDAGLFHAAFLLPTRGDLGRWMRHAARGGLPVQGVADHGVSEAVYLADPEGNGIEIYCDRPRDTWVWSGDTVAMRTDSLDADAVMREAGPVPWTGVPDGTTVGHMHLKVGAIPPAEAFYAGLLGVPVTARYPGGSFFGADRYHHHFAANTWASHGAPSRTEPSMGLANVDIQIAEAATLDAIERRAIVAGMPAERRGAVLLMRDPWGTSLTLTGLDAR